MFIVPWRCFRSEERSLLFGKDCTLFRIPFSAMLFSMPASADDRWISWFSCNLFLQFLLKRTVSFKDCREMGDHFALLVDRLLTESTLEATIGSREEDQVAPSSSSSEDQGKEITGKRTAGDRTSVGELVECRICHEEDEDFNMESPCSCRGSLKVKKRSTFPESFNQTFSICVISVNFSIEFCFWILLFYCKTPE